VSGTQVSPYRYDSGEDANGKHVAITVNYNNATRALISATLHRDAGCLYKKIYIGIGVDGRPDTAVQTFDISNVTGDLGVNAGQLGARGLDTIEDVFALGQITAGP
jgi:hypothetical protein